MHTIFNRSNPERLRAIRDDFAVSLCLHEAGHAWVARACGAPFTMVHLPDLNGRAQVHRAAPIEATDPPAVIANAAGLSRNDRISVLLGGYVGELCLYDRTYIEGGGEFFTRLADSADDAAEIARILGLPKPGTTVEVEKMLVAALKGARHKPYTLLTRDLGGFRSWVSRLHAAWEREGFRSMGLRPDLLPDAP